MGCAEPQCEDVVEQVRKTLGGAVRGKVAGLGSAFCRASGPGLQLLLQGVPWEWKVEGTGRGGGVCTPRKGTSDLAPGLCTPYSWAWRGGDGCVGWQLTRVKPRCPVLVLLAAAACKKRGAGSAGRWYYCSGARRKAGIKIGRRGITMDKL